MQLTTLSFDFPLHPGDIRAFRAAIVECLGLGHQLFHGHDNSEPGVTKYLNAYPLVRFAVHRGRPVIMGIGAGADAILRHLLPVLPELLYVAGRPCPTANWRIQNRQLEAHRTTHYEAFGLYQWMALNKQNYQAWKQYEDQPSVRRLILDRCLTGQLRAFAEAAAPEMDSSQVVGRVLRVDRVKKTRWHGNHFVLFDVVAEANLAPPTGWGVGRCHSFGFGEVCLERHYSELRQRMHNREREMASRID